jgi:AcrR family transcriptional regulator
MTVDASARKPANRPSRRHYLIDAAVELFSLEPWEFITVADIVERAGMTPATFYYHFSSREQLLEEIVQDFAQKWIDMVEQLLAAADTPDALSDVAGQLLDEIDESGVQDLLPEHGKGAAARRADQDRRAQAADPVGDEGRPPA